MSYRRFYYAPGMGLAVIPDDDGALPEGSLPEEEEIELTENGAQEIDFDEDKPEKEIEKEEITTESWMFSSTVAQQIFSIVPGVAGGLAGFILALKLANTKKVKAAEVLLASGIVALTTFAVIFVVKTVEE